LFRNELTRDRVVPTISASVSCVIGWSIDGSSRRNLARYVNHACRCLSVELDAFFAMMPLFRTAFIIACL
jgi:hypothetical protein